MFRRKEEELAMNENESQENTEVKSSTASVSSPVRPATPEARVSPMQPASPYRPAPAAAARPATFTPASSSSQVSSASSQEEKGNGSRRRVLTVGNDILLKGEIATCDRLVIEGAVDATLKDVHTVEIAESGSFLGSAEIQDAEISGVFEGDLIVRNRLVIYSTGKVRGKITYGEIEIERGGELTGEIRTINAADVKAKNKAA